MSPETQSPATYTLEQLWGHYHDTVAAVYNANTEKEAADEALIIWINESEEKFNLVGYPSTVMIPRDNHTSENPSFVGVSCYGIREKRKPYEFAGCKVEGFVDGHGKASLKIYDAESPAYRIMSLANLLLIAIDETDGQ